MFPYPPRPIQTEIVDILETVLKDKGHVIIEAGTGAGKTVASLVPAIDLALREDKAVLYLTRTNSQQVQVVKEFRAISRMGTGDDPAPVASDAPSVLEGVLAEVNGEERPPMPSSAGSSGTILGTCVPLQGRNNMCPLTSDDPELMIGTPEELSRMCSLRKRNTLQRMSGKGVSGPECRFYAAFLLDDGREARDWAKAFIPTAEELVSQCMSQGICPYEVSKALLKEARVVAAPYIFFFSPFIRKNLLEWMCRSYEELIVIVDEAHNLANFIRDIGSMAVSTGSVRMAISELDQHGDHQLSGGRSISSFLHALQASIQSIGLEYLIDEDGVVPPSSLTEEMMVRLSTNSSRIDAIASEAMQHGEAIREAKRAMGKLPRSYIHTCASFYLAWNRLEFDRYTPLIVKGRRGEELFLEAYAMDPTVMTDVLSQVRASVHLSGTLSPLEEYRDSIGLPEDTSMVRLPPPFPPGNRRVLYDTELSTNHERLLREEDLPARIQGRMRSILEEIRGRNVAVFFPSFDLMGSVLGSLELEDGDHLDGEMDLGRDMFPERRGSSQTEVMDLVDRFKSQRGGVLFSVLGGRLSEGMDYPGESLEAVLIVGIPYPKPNARQRALCAYYDMRFRRGWEYTVHAPASRRILQAMGRMIRSEDDRGLCYILDRRAVHFTDAIPDLEPANPNGGEASSFFSER